MTVDITDADDLLIEHPSPLILMSFSRLPSVSGQKRTAVLTTPVQEGDMIVIVASRGGDPQHPAWFHNLKTNPNVEVSMRGGPTRPMRARVADADERARLWPLVTKRYRGYEQYQQRATREIPLVLLEPVTD